MILQLEMLLTALSLTSAAIISSPKIRVRREAAGPERFQLPDNATSIRENIATSFSCQSRGYGYYADTDNDCQLFHVCLPVVWDGAGDERATQTFMWSFICPMETVFNQERFTCARPEDSIPCQESAMLYSLNERFGERPPDRPPPPPEATEVPATSGPMYFPATAQATSSYISSS